MKLVFIILSVLILTGCEMNSDYNPTKEYCEMWKIWHDTDGEYGWPDKNGLYYSECVNQIQR